MFRIEFKEKEHNFENTEAASAKLEVGLNKLRRGIGKGTARALVDDVVVTEGELTFVLAEPPE